MQGSTLTFGDTSVDLADFSGSTMTINGNEIIIDGQRFVGGQHITRNTQGTIVVDSAATVIADGSEDINAGYAGTFQAGPIVLTDARDVQYHDGCVSAGYAGSLIETDNVATAVDQLQYCERTLDVDHADSVWAGCVYMEDVDDTTITAATQVTIEPDQDVTLRMRDCATTELLVHALSDNASVMLSKETITPTYVLHDVELNFTKGNVTESVATNGTATAEIHRQEGIIELALTPVTTYTYDSRDPLQDFGFRAWQSSYILYLRKSATQQLPAAAASCVHCAILDFVAHRLEMRGTIDLHKSQLLPGGKVVGDAPQLFFSTVDRDAKAILTLDNDNALINELFIMTDAPPYKTVISNYITVSESLHVGNTTHRLLELNEKVTKDKLSQSLVKSYRTSYSNATMTITNNDMVYERQGTKVRVLPDGAALIATLLQEIKDKRAMLLLPLVSALALALLLRPRRLLPRDVWLRKGQLTIFLILGLVILMVVGIMLYLVGIVSIGGETIRVTDRQQVQDFVTNCLGLAGTDAVHEWGVQGGHVALQPPYFQSIPTAYLFEYGRSNVLSLSRVELDIAEATKRRLNNCIMDFKPLKGIRVEVLNAPEVTPVLGQREVTFTMRYVFQAHRRDARWDFNDFAASVPIGALQIYQAANATVESQVLHEGRIDLDALPSVQLALFPYEKTLMGLIKDNNGRQLEPFSFFWVNAR